MIRLIFIGVFLIIILIILLLNFSVTKILKQDKNTELESFFTFKNEQKTDNNDSNDNNDFSNMTSI